MEGRGVSETGDGRRNREGEEEKNPRAPPPAIDSFGVLNRYLFYGCVAPIIEGCVRGVRVPMVQPPLPGPASAVGKEHSAAATVPVVDGKVTETNMSDRSFRPIAEGDLLQLPRVDGIEELYKQYQEKKNLSGGGKVSYFSAVLSCAKYPLLLGAFFRLCVSLCEVAIPLVIREFLRSIEDGSFEGLYWVLGLIALQLIYAVATQLQMRLMDVAAVRIRAVTLYAIYEKASSLKLRDADGLQSQVSTLIASDCQRFIDAAPYINLVWANPLQIGLSAYVIVTMIDLPALVSVGIMLCILPISMLFSASLGAVRRVLMRNTQERVQRISEFLQGVRVVKVNGWEPHLQQLILKCRHNELVCFAKEVAVWAVQNAFLTDIDHIAAFAGFAVFVETKGSLKAADAFATLLALTLMKFPIMLFGVALNYTIQLRVAVQRVEAFLSMEHMSGDEAPPSAPTERGEKQEEDNDLNGRGRSYRTHNDDTNQVQLSKKEPASGTCQGAVLDIQNASFTWGANKGTRGQNKDNNLRSGPTLVEKRQFTLTNVSLQISAGEVCAVMGPVGSGKSLLCQSILNETVLLEGAIQAVPRRVAYAAQDPFLLSGTVRDNITFMAPFDERRYIACVDACQLWPDFDIYPDGELTIVGERGVTLSGGQKARIALARVVYANAELVILDDPFSALDAKTGALVAEALFGPSGMLKAVAVLLVTHSKHLLHLADCVLDMDPSCDGTCQLSAVSEEAKAPLVSPPSHGSPAASSSASAVNMAGNSPAEQNPPAGRRASSSPAAAQQQHQRTATEEDGALEQLTAKGSSYALYAKYAGGWLFVCLAVAILAAERCVYISMDVWLSVWTSAEDGLPSHHPLAKGHNFPSGATLDGGRFYLKVFGVILVISFLATTASLSWFGGGGVRASRVLFRNALKAVLQCPMIFFDMTPAGHILNRMTHDVDRIMYPLVAQLYVYFASLGWFVIALAAVAATAPFSMIAVAPALALTAFLLYRFRAANAQYQRLDAASRSQAQAHIFESINGAVTVRALGHCAAFKKICMRDIDVNSKCILNFSLGQRWVSIRAEMCGAVMMVVPPLVCWFTRDSTPPELAGIAVVWACSLSRSVTFSVNDGVQGDGKLVSIERLHEYGTALPTEPSRTSDADKQLPADWPKQGEVELRDVSMRYRPELPLVLNGASMRIAAGKRVGIVGRTGAGKSSLSVALYRLRELCGGAIVIDGVDIARVGLDALRGGHITIVPQDPVVFSGTFRSNVDPFHRATDEEVESALRGVMLWSLCTGAGGKGIFTSVGEQGKDLSVGQRQLLCIARALIHRPTLLILDEATANVDHGTDVMIQKMVRTLFRGTTVIEIAHRLHTVMDADEVIVMAQGAVVESGPPRELLESAGGGGGGAFASMVDATGLRTAAELRRLTQ